MSYEPFANGPEKGKIDACPTCGIKNRNQHSLREAGICDGKKRKVNHEETQG